VGEREDLSEYLWWFFTGAVVAWVFRILWWLLKKLFVLIVLGIEAISESENPGRNFAIAGGVIVGIIGIVILAVSLGGHPGPAQYNSSGSNQAGANQIDIGVPPATQASPMETQVAGSIAATPNTVAPQASSTPPPSGSGGGPGNYSYPVTSDLVLRDGPSSSAHQLALVPSGTRLTIVCTEQGETINGQWGPDIWWDRVAYSGQNGFVTDEYVDTKTDITDRTRIPLC
jgi:hypothetical protein